jgi:hypothetical protein
MRRAAGAGEVYAYLPTSQTHGIVAMAAKQAEGAGCRATLAGRRVVVPPSDKNGEAM